jgi:hypothetical protein
VVRVDELVGGRRHLGKDPQPAEWVVARIEGELPLGHRITTYTMEAVAARDEVALQNMRLAFVRVVDLGMVGLEFVNAHVLALEQERLAGVQTSLDQVLDDLLLAVDRDPTAPGQLVKRDAMRAAVEPQLDPVMNEALPLEALARAHLHE